MKPIAAALVALPLLLAGCADEGMSSRDAGELARARIAAAANVPADQLEVTNLFVGEQEDDLLVCGTVNGPTIGMRRFIVANDPARMVMFERASEVGQQGPADFSMEWSLVCTDRAAG